MRVRRVCDRSTLFLLFFALYWTNQPFLNGRHYRSYESTNWPPKCDSTLNILPPRRDFLYPPSHFRSTHKAAGILLHNTSNYSNKDVLFTTSISHNHWFVSAQEFIKAAQDEKTKKTMLLLSQQLRRFQHGLIGDLTYVIMI